MSTRSGKGAGMVAGLAALAGAALLVVAVVLFAQDREDVPEAAPLTAATTSAPVSAPSATTLVPVTSAEDFVVVSDGSGRVAVRVPASWVDVSLLGWVVDGQEVGPSLAAAVDIEAWLSGWDTPGIFLGVDETRSGDPGDLMGDFSGACAGISRDAYDDGVYFGLSERYAGCGDTGSSFAQVAVAPPDGSHRVLIQIVAFDESVIEQILSDWSVVRP